MDLINMGTKPRSFKTDKAWVDKFESLIKRILGEVFVTTADFKKDTKQATDLLVFSIKPMTIGCRVRRHEQYFKYNYANEFTIRSQRPSGIETELKKIVDGWCDYLFYGFCNKDETEFISYLIGDLKVFRSELTKAYFYKSKGTPEKGIQWKEYKNHDNSSSFYAF